MTDPNVWTDAVIAAADLVGRAGATQFEIGWTRDDVPVELAGWYCSAYYRGARLIVDEHRSPDAAAIALAERILTGGMCRCRHRVALSDQADGCRWRLVGQRWEPGCDVAPIEVDGVHRGDIAALHQALNAGPPPANRRERRAARRKGRRS
nr:hypothetical protein [Micromonospora sp. DSM 115978]